MSKFLRAKDKGDYANGDKDDSKAVAIPRAFSENSRAKNEKAGPNQTLVMDRTRFIYWQSMLKVTETLTFTQLTTKSKGYVFSI